MIAPQVRTTNTAVMICRQLALAEVEERFAGVKKRIEVHLAWQAEHELDRLRDLAWDVADDPAALWQVLGTAWGRLTEYRDQAEATWADARQSLQRSRKAFAYGGTR
jgi:hypothetical protein